MGPTVGESIIFSKINSFFMGPLGNHDTGTMIQEPGYKNRPGYRNQDNYNTGTRIPELGYRNHDTRTRIQESGYRKQDLQLGSILYLILFLNIFSL